MIRHVSISIVGMVQGICFRHYAKVMAERLRVTGWIANLSDGSVQIEAEGEDEPLCQLIDWCHHGPRGAMVETVVTSYSPMLKNYSGFEIRYSW